MRIVAHNGATIWGGAERATVRLLAGLASRGHEVKLLCNSEAVRVEAERQGVKSEILVLAGDLAIHHAFRLKRRLVELDPDIFVVGTFKKLFLASLGARMAGVPRIIARIGLESDTPRSWKYRVALQRWIDGVVVNSNAIAKAFGNNNVRVIHNGVAPLRAAHDRTLVRANLGIAPDSFLIGTVARLAIQKRIDRLVDAVALLPDEVHCIVAGDGTRRNEIEAVMRDRNVVSRVRLLGHRNDVADVVSALDVYVVSSETEGLSNAMLEAMSAGIPIVSTDVSGARDALVPDDPERAAGLVVDRTPAAIAVGVQRLMSDPALRKSLGQNGARRASTEFSMSMMLDAWEAFIAERT
jgi:glycosyltransferase involved in cell wall biosynthesis